MIKLSYTTPIKMQEKSGGISAVNFALFEQLQKNFKIISNVTIQAKPDLFSKIISKSKRILGLKGNYHFYSDKRLKSIKNSFNELEDVDVNFFFGFTPWIKIMPFKPYYCLNDASFKTYVEIYNDQSKFSQKDLYRIFNLERKWLSNAKKVFFQSNWALEETKKNYNLSGDNFLNVGVGGFIDIPQKDKYRHGFNFLFMAREFLPKGGDIAVKAIKLVQKKIPSAKLWIIGEKPPGDDLNLSFVEYKGFYRKEDPKQLTELTSIYENCFALIHPTIKDVNPLVISELAYFGCPAISTNSFAIPELVVDGKSGFILSNPRDHHELAEKMLKLIENPEWYKTIRKSTRQISIDKNTWNRVGEKISATIFDDYKNEFV